MLDIKTIESLSNKTIVELKKLKDKKYRKQSGTFLIEGERFVKEALIQNAGVKQILFTDEMEETVLNMVSYVHNTFTLIKVTKEIIKELTDTVTPQGIVAEVSIPQIHPNIILEGRRLLYLDRIQDPGNLGTIIRSAHAFSFEGIIIGKGTVDPYSDKVLRSTMGSIFKVPIIDSTVISLDIIIEDGFKVLISDLSANKTLKEVANDLKFIVVIGNEANGVSGEILSKPHESFIIPMPGNAESLNAAVAASIIMYELSCK